MSVKWAYGQTAEWSPKADDGKGKRLIIKQLYFKGNKRTKEAVLRRELEISPGMNIRLDDTSAFFKYEANKLFNTRLFNLVVVSPINYQNSTDSLIADTTDLLVSMHERWYLFPLPVFELSDRSFNEWFYNRNADISRINYGMRFVQYNLAGYNDPLSFTIQTGFTQSYELAYQLPFIDKKLNTSLGLNVGYYTNKFVAMRTVNNKQVFDSAFNQGRTRLNAAISLNRRVGFFQTHNLSLSYDQNTLPDELVAKNPDYFLNGRNYQQYLTLSYLYIFDYRNIRYYPTKGWFLSADFDWEGVLPGDNNKMLVTDLTFSKFFDLGSNFYSGHRVQTTLSTPNEQSYLTATGMRFGRFGVRGYELYMVEGPVTVISRNSFRYKIFDRVFNFEKRTSLRQINKIPVAVYLKTYADFGYIYAPFVRPTNERLSNKLLSGGGLGFDIATFYDLIFKFEYSFNQLGERPNLFVGASFDL